MKNIIKIFTILYSLNASAITLTLDNVTQSDFDDITKEFGANFVHSPVTPPNSLGDIFGLEIGIVAGATTVPGIGKIIKREDPSANTSGLALPHAAILAQVSVPFGVSFELTMFPKTEISNTKFSTFTFAGKWTLTDQLLQIPLVDIAARFHMGSSDLSYQTTSAVSSVPVDTKVALTSSSLGANISAGLNFVFIKPYIGLGFVSTDNKLAVSSTATIFDTSFTAATSAEKKHSGSHFYAGVELDLFFIHFGAEYSSLLGVERITGKFSLAI